ncbi:exodeoxyribonuclease V subunit gamma [Phytopseudomonas dryadis]|uniref:RecBCD enzyme subunit RecC n=1 Tax=Phytopseudomonas dryadis TaxID=2487520 RepID=A0A4Q9QZ44_9GAMM|nr:exodeoxyribonuclease V subunit gamma [Pseudomonas dryadis]TBU91189.1 exodeoxyribonuclease V subunit gamma [Pseudomonas dryadis]
MLSLYHAPDLETLGELATTLLAQPLREPFDPLRVVVPSQGIGRWLTLELARKQGIAMQLEVQLPAKFVWDLSRLVLGQLPEQSAFSPATLSWRLYDWLCEPEHLAEAPRLAHYLAGGDERRRLGLAAKIADVFDQYLLYRDDWLAAWENQTLLGLGPDEAWQALLWRELTRDGHPHRARLLEDLLQRLYRDDAIDGLPERLLVFGISSLPPHHLRVLQGLARHTEVVIFALNPCREAWGEIRDIRELARDGLRPAEDAAGEPAPDDWYLDVGHPLLASLGKQGRDFFDALFALTAEEGGQEFGLYAEDAELRDGSLLQALQNDILRLRTRHADERLVLRPDDRSLELHIAHSPLREVEILHDQLLARFQADPSLSPDQVVVLTPDIERYAPYIEAVFAASRGGPRTAVPRMAAPRMAVPLIPFSLADRSLRAELPLIDAFLGLLALPDSRFTGEDVLAWLEQPALARRAGIEAEDLPLLRDWLREAGVRWGRDAEHRRQLELPADAAFTWRQGLDRLLLGFAAPPQLAGARPPLLESIWPLDALEGGRAQLLGRLSAFVERLATLAQQLQRPRSLAAWSGTLLALIDNLFDEREAGDTLLLLSRACAALQEQAQAAGIERPLELALIRQQLTSALEQGGGASGFLTGAVTFCTMVPMRSLPFRQVCLLGLDDGALPRRTPVAGFDLIGQHPRRGDRARRLDDRYLLLETLLSARSGLYLSYVGRDPRSNAELPPSVLVSELLDVIDLTARTEGDEEGATASQRITVQHPLQPFAPGNFAGAQRAGFSVSWFQAAERLSQPFAQPAPFASPLAAPDDDWLTLEPGQLIHCFKHPARFLLEQRLGLRLAQGEEALAGDEPFSVEWSSQHGLRQLALQAIEQGWSETQERAVAAASGWLPVGELGQAHWGQIRGPIRAFAPTLFAERPGDVAQPLAVDIELAGVRIHGWLDGVSGAGLFDYRLRDLGAWELAPFWLRHLLLNCCATPGIRRDSRLLSPKSEWRLGPLDDPRALLQPWLEAYRSALCEPLPVLARCSYGFARKWRHPGRKAPIDAARAEARVMWQGNDFMSGEGQDPWNALAFRDRDPLDARFEALAEQLYGPALDALQGSAEEDA